MRVIAKSKITEYCATNKDAEVALEEWHQNPSRVSEFLAGSSEPFGIVVI